MNELNTEAVSALSIADLSTVITLHKLYPQSPKSRVIVAVFQEELDKRINDIIIF